MHGVDCEAVEIDPTVVDIARGRFGFDGRATIADGRTFLARTSKRWDLIFLDVCTSDRLAWHLFTVEGMRLLRERLAAGGILAIQFIGDDGPWSTSLGRTVNAAFGESLMLSAAVDIGPVGPRWLLAGRDYPARLPEELFASSDQLPWRTVTPADEGSLLTDDHFPAELHWARVAGQWRSLYAAAP